MILREEAVNHHRIMLNLGEWNLQIATEPSFVLSLRVRPHICFVYKRYEMNLRDDSTLMKHLIWHKPPKSHQLRPDQCMLYLVSCSCFCAV